jgi:hypothetical protein
VGVEERACLVNLDVLEEVERLRADRLYLLHHCLWGDGGGGERWRRKAEEEDEEGGEREPLRVEKSKIRRGKLTHGGEGAGAEGEEEGEGCQWQEEKEEKKNRRFFSSSSSFSSSLFSLSVILAPCGKERGPGSMHRPCQQAQSTLRFGMGLGAWGLGLGAWGWGLGFGAFSFPSCSSRNLIQALVECLQKTKANATHQPR